jgi:hypothetical protein
MAKLLQTSARQLPHRPMTKYFAPSHTPKGNASKNQQLHKVYNAPLMTYLGDAINQAKIDSPTSTQRS